MTKSLRQHAGQLGVEIEHDQEVDSALGKEPRLGAKHRQPEGFILGAEEFARVRLEHEHRQRRPSRFAIVSASAMSARWPRWTPSKLPSATTAPFASAGGLR
jgi:hypothetical protein